MIFGFLFIVIGGLGTFFTGFYIANDRRYTWSSPYTDHEIMIIALLIVFIILIMVGIVTEIFSVVKKNNEDTLRRVQNITNGNRVMGVCPSCGLNLSDDTEKCPKCGTVIKQKGEAN